MPDRAPGDPALPARKGQALPLAAARRRRIASRDDVLGPWRDRLDNLKGLFHRAPFAALVIGIAMLSLAGIPPFPGLVAKFLIFKNVMAAGHIGYAVLGLVGSYLGIYFYLQVIQFMFMSPNATAKARSFEMPASFACVAAALLLT